jgi:RNA polymerase sigma factor (sigma-70 family)
MRSSDPKSPKSLDTPAEPAPTLVTAGGVRVFVRDLPVPARIAPPEEEEQEEPPPDPFPRVIVFPPNQPVEERDAFVRWVDKQWGAFIDMKLRRGDILEESARDLHQKVLMFASAEYEKQKRPPQNVQAFLDTVIVHVICTHGQRVRPEFDEDTEADATAASAPTPESAAARAELLEKLRRYVTHLAPEEAEVFEAREVRGLTFEEIAAALGRSLSTVSSRYDRALRKLRDLARASERRATLRARR